jgi:hypothetical protein
MTAALARTAASDFNGDFYVAVATLIPVLFLALAVEGRFIKTLLGASSWAMKKLGEVVGALVLAFFIKFIISIFGGKRDRAAALPRRPPGLLRRSWQTAKTTVQGRAIQAAIIAAIILTLAPAGLAACIVLLGTASEIAAIVTLYYGHATSWTGPVVLTGVIFLVVLIGTIPAAVLARGGYELFAELAGRTPGDKAGTKDTPGTGQAAAEAAGADPHTHGSTEPAADPAGANITTLPEPPATSPAIGA